MSSETRNDAGIYVHIPYCRRKCDYCSFYSITSGEVQDHARPAVPDAYIRALLHEIEQRSTELKQYIFNTIYIGGGTPSLLGPEQVRMLLKSVRENIATTADGMEITLECNPEDFTEDGLCGFRDAGVSRIVLGVQTLNTALHDFIGRSGAVCTPSMLLDFKRIAGITHCIDLITGIPGQTIDDISSELSVIAAMRPEHISAYMLSVDKGTRLHARVAPDDTFQQHQRDIFSEVMRVLENEGYEHYEVSNFALPGFRSRHNVKYWTFRPYAGFGPGAHSFIGGRRFANAPEVDNYISLSNRLVFDERNDNAETVEYVMTGMRLAWGISEKRYLKDTGRAFPGVLRTNFFGLKNSGYVNISSDGDDINYSFTRKGLFIMDMLLADLLDEFIR